MIMPSMAADICDEDEWNHGVRREGMFGAALSWFNKTAVSLSFLGSGVALNLVGFDAARGGAQTPGAILGMRLVLVFGTIVPAVLALAVLRFYPLNERRAAKIRADLEARRGVR
jgi:GPH family glycoside/pentoside/hexuronide:cation symporter